MRTLSDVRSLQPLPSPLSIRLSEGEFTHHQALVLIPFDCLTSLHQCLIEAFSRLSEVVADSNGRERVK